MHEETAGETARARRRRDWGRRGLVGPVVLLAREEAARIGAEFREQYARSGSDATRNRHADLPVLGALCANPEIWQPAHEILGDELLLWRTNMFLGNPTLPWHEDRYAGLFEREAFTLSMLLAIEDSPPDNCTVFAAGSHRLTVPEKEERYGLAARVQAGGNVRYIGEIAPDLHEPRPLRAGEAILFHPEVLHASAGFVAGEAASPATDRMSLTFRIASRDAVLRDEAFPETRERRDDVLRTISRASQAAR